MAEYLIEDTTLTSLGNSIRSLNDTTATLTPAQMKTTVDNAVDEVDEQTELIAQCLAALEGKVAGSGDEIELQSKTVSPTTSQQVITADSGYDGLESVTISGMPTATQATPSISVSSSGLITASSTQSTGYVSGSTKSATKQLTTQAAKTVTPSTSSQTAVASGTYTTGAVTVGAIPSTYEQVTTETNAYTSELTKLTNAVTALEQELAGKAAGGGSSVSLGTCELTINCGSYTVYSITYTTLDSNGNPIYSCITPNSTIKQTITCLCNSPVIISWNKSSIYSNHLNNSNVEILHSRAYFVSFAITTEAGESANFTAENNNSGGGID